MRPFLGPGTDPLGVKVDHKPLRLPLAVAESRAAVLLDFMPRECYEKVMLCGSIRRRRPDVGDIDCVLLPNRHTDSAFVTLEKEGTLKPLIKKDGRVMLGKAIRSYIFRGIQVDFYISRPDTFGITCFVRTGSKEHNIRIASVAKRKGLRLRPTEGLYDGLLRVDDDTDDRSIFEILGLPYLPPEKRDIGNW